MALQSLLSAFHEAILTGDTAPFLPALKDNGRLAPQKQLSIYIEGYRTRLLEAVRADYPATIGLMGEAAFDARALSYIEATPPAHYSLDPYPYPFAAYLRNCSGPGLAADVAALESAIADIFLHPDSEALTPAALEGLTLERFGTMVLHPRTASCLLALDYPAERYLALSREGHAPDSMAEEKMYLCLVRHENEVKRHVLAQAEHAALSRIREGLLVGEALEAVAVAHPDCLEALAANLHIWFARWMEAGFFRVNAPITA